MFEPLVDTVEANQICTTEQCIWEADLLTVTKQELEIETQYRLQVRGCCLIVCVFWCHSLRVK